MTIPRDDLLQGCIAIGLIFTYLPIMTWLRARRAYPDGGVPYLGIKRVVYGLFLGAGLTCLVTAGYALLHPDMQSLTLPSPGQAASGLFDRG